MVGSMDNVEQKLPARADTGYSDPIQQTVYLAGYKAALLTVAAETTKAVLAELEDLAVVYGDGAESPIIYTQRGKMNVTERIAHLKQGVIK